MKKEAHWDIRGRLNSLYEGESFYTLTPLPLYIKRREILLDLLVPYIKSSNHICDLGCGDGWYIHYFTTVLGSEKTYVGIDSSLVMIEKARLLNPNAYFFQSESGINCEMEDKKFQLIYTIATLAHISDEKLQILLKSVASNLDINGRYIIFEQVAPVCYGGEFFVRRTVAQYEEFLKQAGFEVESIEFIRFRSHQFFERYIAKNYYRFLCHGENDYEKRINANSHLIFQILSHFFLLFDIKANQKDVRNGWGNAFMVFKKTEYDR
jgi:ubiquinone/menaquinone biosynthesis C-methylase UbiE